MHFMNLVAFTICFLGLFTVSDASSTHLRNRARRKAEKPVAAAIDKDTTKKPAMVVDEDGNPCPSCGSHPCIKPDTKCECRTDLACMKKFNTRLRRAWGNTHTHKEYVAYSVDQQ